MSSVFFTGKTEGMPGTWSHCGNQTAHRAHKHDIVTFEDAYTNVQCLGTLRSIDDRRDELMTVDGSRHSGMNRKEVLRAQIASMQQELTELEQFPSDNFEVGTIVAFDKRFADNDEALFSYSAIKGTATTWYLSGLISKLLNTPVDRNGARTFTQWEALTYLMRDALNVRVIFKTDGHDLVGSSAESNCTCPVVKPKSRTFGPADPGEETYDAEPEVRTPVRDPSRF